MQRTPGDLALELGEPLRAERLRQDITMEALCLKAGVSKPAGLQDAVREQIAAGRGEMAGYLAG